MLELSFQVVTTNCLMIFILSTWLYMVGYGPLVNGNFPGSSFPKLINTKITPYIIPIKWVYILINLLLFSVIFGVERLHNYILVRVPKQRLRVLSLKLFLCQGRPFRVQSHCVCSGEDSNMLKFTPTQKYKLSSNIWQKLQIS